MSDKEKTLDLETSMQEINTLIEAMEQGKLSLDESLNRFERGIHLINNCQKILHDAEKKVEILIEKNGQEKLEAYESNGE